MTTETSAYVFDAAWKQERERLGHLEAVWDPGTIRHLETIGVGEGWRCAEIGGGSGSIAEWLSRRVGPTGQVVATDIETKFLVAISAPNVEVRRHDIAEDDLEEGAFDLVHTRHVLQHVPERYRALDRMFAAVKPGGWLVVEDVDVLISTPDQLVEPDVAEAFAKAMIGSADLIKMRGGDMSYGRRLYRDMRALGLEELAAEGRVPMVFRGSPMAEITRLSYAQLGDRLMAAGALTAEELALTIAGLQSPSFFATGILTMAVWGRRPKCVTSSDVTAAEPI